jgi:hypothetical protein
VDERWRHLRWPFNRHTIASAVTDDTGSLTIDEFEHVAAGPSVTLLRVRADLSGGAQAPDRRPELVAEYPGGLERFAALPSPPDPPGVLRAAYSVPATLIAPEITFTLELDGGLVVPLHPPSAGAARRPEPADEADPVRAEHATLSARLAELEIWSGELERRIADTTDQLADARSRLAAAELDALSARAEAQAAEQAARELAAARTGR